MQIIGTISLLFSLALGTCANLDSKTVNVHINPLGKLDSGKIWIRTPDGVKKLQKQIIEPNVPHGGVYVRETQDAVAVDLFEYQVYSGKSCQENELLYTAKFDSAKLNTLWTKHRINAGGPMPECVAFKNEFFDCDSENVLTTHTNIEPKIDSAYTANTEVTFLNQQVGINENMENLQYYYICPKEEFVKGRCTRSQMLEKGHLVPNADFGGVLRKTTYLYFNAVPQWKTINGGNWKKIEAYLRNKYSGKPSPNIYTGTKSILQLQHAQEPERAVDMHLTAWENVDGLTLPIPRYIWKAVENEITIVVVNYPKAMDWIALNELRLLGCTTEHCKSYFEEAAVLENQQNELAGYFVCCNYDVAHQWMETAVNEMKSADNSTIV